MTNTGKIGRLPKAIGEQVNQRLLNGDSDEAILKWLHTLNEVWTIIRQEFHNGTIIQTDLSEWRTTAFAEWKLRREFAYDAQKPVQLAAGELKTSARQVADHLAEVLAGQYARLMHNWDGEATGEFTSRLRALTHLCRDICALRKSEHQAALIRLAEAKLALRQKQSEAETEAAFLKRLDEPGMRERILHHYNNTPAPNPSPETPDASPQTPPLSHPIKPNQASPGVGTARPQSKSSPDPSPTPRAQSPEPKAQSDSIKPNQGSSGVVPSRPDQESSAALSSPAPPDPKSQTPDSIQTPDPRRQTQSGSIRPNQTKSRDSRITSNVLPGDPGYVEDDAPDIYSRPNPAIAARKPKKEEPIVRGFVSPVSYFASDNRNDVHY